MKRSIAGLTVAILIGLVASGFLIEVGQKAASTKDVSRSSLVILWLLTWGCLAVATTILGRSGMRVTPDLAVGVTALSISLGAILKSLDAPVAIAASLGTTLCVVVMASASAGFRRSLPPSYIAIASAFWLLAASILAGSTWTCVFGD